jgi:hypothetical protein
MCAKEGVSLSSPPDSYLKYENIYMFTLSIKTVYDVLLFLALDLVV